MHAFAQILEDAGGAGAPPEQAARLRTALAEELRRGASELLERRSGYDAPLTVAFAGGLALVPAPAALRADPGAAPERGWLLAAATLGALVEAGGEAVQAGEWEGHLALAAGGADPELAVLAFEEQV